MKFFNTIDELRTHVSITAANKIESFNGANEYAINEHLKKRLGADFLSDSLTAYNANSVDPIWTNILPMIQATLANFMLVHQIPIQQVTIESSGITRKENANFKSAYQNQINQLIAEHFERAYNHLETLLAFLEENESDYPTWTTSDAYSKNRAFFINSATDFQEQYPIIRGRITFKSLFSTMRDVEALYIKVLLGDAFYEELKTKIEDKTAFSAKESELVAMLKKGIAFHTIENAIQSNWIKVTQNSVIYIEHDKDTNHLIEKSAQQVQASNKIAHAKEFGERWLGKALSFIKSNLDDFPTFKEDESVNPPEEDEQGCAVKTTKPTSFFSV